MDAVYFQCPAARLTVFSGIMVSTGSDDTLGKEVGMPALTIGTFRDHTGIQSTFQGYKVLRGTANTVNQSISSSFDLAKLTCVSCGNEHPIINKTALMFSS
jgi:hypothetical protein